MIYGYARVSTDGQSVDAQVKQLRAAAAAKVYRETASGAKTERAQLRRVLGQLAVQDHAGLVFLQPSPQSRPGLEQDVVRDLSAVGLQRYQAVAGKGLQDRADLHRMMPGVGDAIARGVAEFRPSYVVPGAAGTHP